ncbi:hypothetical protein EBZ80_15700 [bacterium]|nr:hypothetical protein [bacterium]
MMFTPGVMAHAAPPKAPQITPTKDVAATDEMEPDATPEAMAPAVPSGPAKAASVAPVKLSHSIGVELASSSFGALGTSAVNYGLLTPKYGVEFYLGHSKSADTISQSESSVTNTSATPNSRTTSVVDSGKVNPRQYTFGIQPKYVMFADRWLRATAGFMLAYTNTGKVSYKTGTTTTSWSDISQDSNYSVQRNAVGTIETKTTPRLLMGPRINADFLLRWFPHLSLGFSTGIMVGSGAASTTETNTESKSFAVQDGVEQTPSSHTTTSQKVSLKQGLTGETIAVGGTTFNLMGSFTLRYVW